MVKKSLTKSLDLSYLESLMGYNARRAALAIIEDFNLRMVEIQLKPVEFSVLSLISRNPNISAKEICSALFILPPNIVSLLKSLESRGLISRQIDDKDKRQIALSLTNQGKLLIKKAEKMATQSDKLTTQHISSSEREQLISLLKKIYQEAS
jgi:DNA-binding MarR family transcriptional regulator